MTGCLPPAMAARRAAADRVPGQHDRQPASRSAGSFLARIRSGLADGDALLLGTDLVKDPAVLVSAYDDEAGITAAFNKNVLSVLNHELGADFDPDAFEHVARWDAGQEWIEMRLRASRPQTVRLPAIDLTVEFAAGEEMRTEVSAKFRREGVRRELAAAGFALDRWWTDGQGRFGLSLARPPDQPRPVTFVTARHRRHFCHRSAGDSSQAAGHVA